MKTDTIYFVLKSDEEKFTFKSNEILEQIMEQKHNFIRKFGYEPIFINIKNDLVDYLFKNINIKVINAKNIEYPKIVYGMKIKLRYDDLGLYNNEIICI